MNFPKILEIFPGIPQGILSDNSQGVTPGTGKFSKFSIWKLNRNSILNYPGIISGCSSGNSLGISLQISPRVPSSII